MPAYRSEAEAEVRDAVVARLRTIRPGARIMHEINASYFGNRIDVLAVSPAEIIAVEVKSKKDKLTRLPSQAEAMRGVAHHIIVALHEKFLVPRETNKHRAEYERDGIPMFLELPEEARRGCMTWVFPETDRGRYSNGSTGKWGEPEATVQAPLPAAALGILWRDELHWLCQSLGIAIPQRANMAAMTCALRWGATGRDITRGVCAALRARDSIEADAPIRAEVAA